MRVLVAEDEMIIALDLEALVIDGGHEVCGLAKTEDEAIALAVSQAPDVILSDISLARGTSGITAMRKIISKHDVAIIFVSAGVASIKREDLDAIRPVALISKPIDPITVKEALMRAEETLRSR